MTEGSVAAGTVGSREESLAGNVITNRQNRIISVSNVSHTSSMRSKIRFLNTNAQSLQYKINELIGIVSERNVQVMAITESWGKPWKDAIFNIEGFNLYRKDRNDGRQGGGCALYVSQELKSYPCRELINVQGDDAVWCWIKAAEDMKVLVGCIYRSSGSSAVNSASLINQIRRASEVAGNNKFVLLGDFNLPEISWRENEASGDINALPSRFFEGIKDCFLYQHILVPTRFRNEQSSTLDLVFTKEEHDVKNIEVIQPLGKSDHGVIICDYVCEWETRDQVRPKRQYHKGDYVKMTELLNEVNWEHEFEGKSVLQKWELFKEKLEDISCLCIPTSEPKRYQAPWMNRKVVRIFKRKYFAWQRYLEHDNSTRWREYVKERNKAVRIERDERRRYEKKLVKEIGKNRRGFFKYVNSRLTVRPELSALFNENGDLVHEEREMANICNYYFHSAFNNPTENEELPDMATACESNIRNIIVTVELVRQRLETLNKFKGSGPDNIHPWATCA